MLALYASGTGTAGRSLLSDEEEIAAIAALSPQEQVLMANLALQGITFRCNVRSRNETVWWSGYWPDGAHITASDRLILRETLYITDNAVKAREAINAGALAP